MDDPGGIFDSDEHRRVATHLPFPFNDPMDEDALAARLGASIVELDHAVVADLDELLQDLEADGYVGKTKAGWKLTKKGADALQAPVPEGDN